MSAGRVLNQIPEEPIEDISQLWWDERTKVGMMDDKHLQNALLKLQGLSLKGSYIGEPELRSKWIEVLRKEQLKREHMRRAAKVD